MTPLSQVGPKMAKIPPAGARQKCPHFAFTRPGDGVSMASRKSTPWKIPDLAEGCQKLTPRMHQSTNSAGKGSGTRFSALRASPSIFSKKKIGQKSRIYSTFLVEKILRLATKPTKPQFSSQKTRKEPAQNEPFLAQMTATRPFLQNCNSSLLRPQSLPLKHF